MRTGIILVLNLVALFITTISFAQQPSLVLDLEEGSGDIGIEFQNNKFKGAYTNGGYLMHIGNKETGNELYFIKDKTVSLVKDFNEGSSDAWIQGFTNIGSKVYFRVSFELWSSDGTESGTILEDTDLSSDIIKGGDGNLYYSTYDSLYIRDDSGIIASFPSNVYTRLYNDYSSHSNSNVTPYKDGIAYIYTNDNSTKVYYIDSNGYSEIASMSNSEWTEVRTTSSFGDGLIFSLSGGSVKKTFSLVESEGIIKKIENKIYKYAVKINDESCMLVDEFRIKVFNNNSPKGKTLDSDAAEFYSSFPHSIINDKIIYLNKDYSSSHQVSISDGHTADEVVITENRYFSNIISKDNYSFFASGTGNGRLPFLYIYNDNTSETEILYEFPEYSSKIQSVMPICLLDETLYFFYNLDVDYGREIFSLDFPGLVSTNNYPNKLESNLSQQSNNTFIITENKSNSNNTISVYTTSGRLVKRFNAISNQTFVIEELTGLYMIQVENSYGSFTNKFFVKNE